MEEGIERGRILEKLEALEEKIDNVQSEMTVLKMSMNKGWGILIGVAGTAGLFATDLVNGFKRFMGWS